MILKVEKEVNKQVSSKEAEITSNKQAMEEIVNDPREEEKDSKDQQLPKNRSSIQSPIDSGQSIPAEMLEGYFKQINKEPSADHVEGKEMIMASTMQQVTAAIPLPQEHLLPAQDPLNLPAATIPDVPAQEV